MNARDVRKHFAGNVLVAKDLMEFIRRRYTVLYPSVRVVMASVFDDHRPCERQCAGCGEWKHHSRFPTECPSLPTGARRRFSRP